MPEGITRIQRKRHTAYKATIDAGIDPETGRRRRISKTFDSESEAEVWRAEQIIAQRHGGLVVDSSDKLSVYLTRWLDTQTELRPSSRNRYERTIRMQIVPVLGNVALDKLAPNHVEQLKASLAKRGLAPSTIGDAYTLLKSALDTAVKWELLHRNPALAIDPPKERKTKREVWTVAQVRSFLTATRDDELGLCWVLAAHLGLRRGELLGLMWGDLDLERGVATIRHGLTEDEGRHIVIGDPKTEAGERELGLAPSVVAALNAQRDRQAFRRSAAGSAWHDTDLVIDRGDGRKVSLSKYNYSFHRARKRLELPYCVPHQLRHWIATSMMANPGIPDAVASRILGHSSIRITADTYFHDDIQMKQAAARLVDEYLWNTDVG